jgi:hypothetical protein
MLERYKKMEREGIIGPYDANGQPRPYQEYPKWIATEHGAVIVQSKREELAKIAEMPQAAEDDPVVAENRALRSELADMRKKLDELAFAGVAGPVDPRGHLAAAIDKASAQHAKATGTAVSPKVPENLQSQVSLPSAEGAAGSTEIAPGVRLGPVQTKGEVHGKV